MNTFNHPSPIHSAKEPRSIAFQLAEKLVAAKPFSIYESDMEKILGPGYRDEDKGRLMKELVNHMPKCEWRDAIVMYLCGDNSMVRAGESPAFLPNDSAYIDATPEEQAMIEQTAAYFEGRTSTLLSIASKPQ